MKSLHVSTVRCLNRNCAVGGHTLKCSAKRQWPLWDGCLPKEEEEDNLEHLPEATLVGNWLDSSVKWRSIGKEEEEEEEEAGGQKCSSVGPRLIVLCPCTHVRICLSQPYAQPSKEVHLWHRRRQQQQQQLLPSQASAPVPLAPVNCPPVLK